MHDHEEDVEDEFPQRHGLPSFPDNPLQKGFAQAAIKDAVTTESLESEENTIGSTPSNERSFKAVEIEEWSASQSIPPLSRPAATSSASFTPSMHEQSSIPPLASILPPPQVAAPLVRAPVYPSPSFASPGNPMRPQKNTDVFVKIDKFYSAKRALESVDHKLDEIEELLRKIREVKMREEQEIASWEKDVSMIKSRLKEVTSTIFEKVDYGGLG